MRRDDPGLATPSPATTALAGCFTGRHDPDGRQRRQPGHERRDLDLWHDDNAVWQPDPAERAISWGRLGGRAGGRQSGPSLRRQLARPVVGLEWLWLDKLNKPDAWYHARKFVNLDDGSLGYFPGRSGLG